jgi:hypothetical protein
MTKAKEIQIPESQLVPLRGGIGWAVLTARGNVYGMFREEANARRCLADAVKFDTYGRRK